MIILDTAEPIDGPTLVSACRAVGAEGAAGYLREWPQWTGAVARALIDAELQFLPIELFGGQPPDDTLRLLELWGLPLGPVALDVETGSWPSDAWQLAWYDHMAEAGYRPVGYSQASTSVTWDWRWGASYGPYGGRRAIQPVIPIPGGWDAIQYAHDIVIGPLTVDASNFGFDLMRQAGSSSGFPAPPPIATRRNLEGGAGPLGPVVPVRQVGA